MTRTDETLLTERVLEQFGKTADPRSRELLLAMVTHLHSFARETGLTFPEWLKGIEFLTRVGQMCSEKRQEYILLSDVLGLSMLVDAIDHRDEGGASESTVLGPFFVEQAPELAQGADLGPGLPGTPLHVAITVAGEDGQPLSGADVVVWHTDDSGLYDIQHGDGRELFHRGRFRTDHAGRLAFWTIAPPPYPIPDDGPVGDLLRLSGRHPWRPAHVHFRIAAPGYRDLITHLFVAGGEYLDSDAVFGVKDSLIVDLSDHTPGPGPGDRDCSGGWKSMTYDFKLARAVDAHGDPN